MINTTSVYQDAIRLLFILVNGSEELIDETNINIKGIFRGKARLYAMDFWVRYPDYFANELILKYKDTNETRYLNLAEKIFENENLLWRRGRYMYTPSLWRSSRTEEVKVMINKL